MPTTVGPALHGSHPSYCPSWPELLSPIPPHSTFGLLLPSLPTQSTLWGLSALWGTGPADTLEPTWLSTCSTAPQMVQRKNRSKVSDFRTRQFYTGHPKYDMEKEALTVGPKQSPKLLLCKSPGARDRQTSHRPGGHICTLQKWAPLQVDSTHELPLQ